MILMEMKMTDLEKREAFEAWLFSTEKFKTRNKNFLFMSDEYGNYEDISVLEHWETWQAAKAQAVPEWINVKDALPGDDIGRVLAWVIEQNSLGKCGFVWNCSHSNGVFSDKFETFQVTHWMPLPDVPQESGND